MSIFRCAKMCSPFSDQEVKEYLADHPALVEEFLMKNASEEFLINILDKKRKSNLVNHDVEATKEMKEKGRYSTIYSDTGIEVMSRNIIGCVNDDEIHYRIYQMCQLIKTAVAAHEVRVYSVDTNEEFISLYQPDTGSVRVDRVGQFTTFSAHVAAAKVVLNIENIDSDTRFPHGVGDEKFTGCQGIGIPLLLDCRTTFMVIEFLRFKGSERFSPFQVELMNGILTWVMVCLQKMKLNKLLILQDALNNFLLDTTKVMFEDMENKDTLITNIMAFTKDLVSADRCALFLVDEERQELFADYFDEGRVSDSGISLFTKKSQIRFPRDKGIAGYVARTGETLNIRDAYSDPRFNTEIDKKTGYRTRNILCMPILGKNDIIGVVQMINRKNADYFTTEDVSAFKLFAVYCALALHYSRLYNLLVQEQTKYKVAMEVLHFHLSCTEEEARRLQANPYLRDEQVPVAFEEFAFCCYDYEEILPQLFIRMMEQMFGNNTFDVQRLCRFVLTIRKNYRPVQYHNWHHGIHVAHCLWRIMSVSKLELTNLQKMALLVGGICHDIDHRGYNNEFFKKLHLPLANLYTTSVMEQHHYKQTVTILHAEGQDIFSFLTIDEHKEVLRLIKQYILATDLALYFPNQKFLSGLTERKEFDPNVASHRDGLLSLMMTAADLCAICKPWETQKKTAKFIYEEFYTQGDEEKKRGIQPIPMMDRINEKDIPKMQVGFIGFICKPAYTTLHALLPETKPLLDGCIVCKENWEKVNAEVAAAAAAAEKAAAEKFAAQKAAAEKAAAEKAAAEAQKAAAEADKSAAETEKGAAEKAAAEAHKAAAEAEKG